MAMLSEVDSKLSEDLVVEILIRLPVKSLLRFKLVCKFWYDLIKSPNFIQTHLNHSSARNKSILIKSHGRHHQNSSFILRSYESLDLIAKLDMKMHIPLNFSSRLYVCGICNGLLCISDFDIYTLLYNPAIGEYKKLHHPSFGSQNSWSYKCMAIGFGFDSVTNDYKVVLFVRLQVDEDEESSEIDESSENDESSESSENAESENDESSEVDQSSESSENAESDKSSEVDQSSESSEVDQSSESSENGESDESSEGDQSSESSDTDESDEDIIRVGVYNLGTSSWRKIHYKPNLSRIDHHPVYVPPVNGALHWIAESKGERGNIEHKVILSFDMSTEVVRYIELPDDPHLKFSTWVKKESLTVFNESLALFTYARPFYAGEFVYLWVMHEYGMEKSWAKQITIGPMTRIERPLLLWKNKSILLEKRQGHLVSCDLETPEIISRRLRGFAKLTGFMIYHESLVSIT